MVEIIVDDFFCGDFPVEVFLLRFYLFENYFIIILIFIYLNLMKIIGERY